MYLQTPRVFQSLMLLSRAPETICLLSAENATLRTSLVCPINLRVVLHLEISKFEIQNYVRPLPVDS